MQDTFIKSLNVIQVFKEAEVRNMRDVGCKSTRAAVVTYQHAGDRYARVDFIERGNRFQRYFSAKRVGSAK